MNQEQVIELKVGPQNSNPAKNEVLEPSTDTVLKVYLRESQITHNYHLKKKKFWLNKLNKEI